MTDVAWESRGAFKTAAKDTAFLIYGLTAPPSVKAANEFTRRRVAGLLMKFSYLNGVWGETNVSGYLHVAILLHCPQRTDVPFTNSAIAEVLYKTLFHPKPSREVVESMKPMPIGAIALASTAVSASSLQPLLFNGIHYH
jgi:hypothetical protein